MAKTSLNKLDPTDLKTKILPAFIDTYPSLKHLTPSSWVVWNKEGKSLRRFNRPCHSEMVYDGPDWDDLITAVPNGDDLSIEYQRMLVSGPFKSVADMIKLEKFDDKYYIHCNSLNKWPANVLYNYCIATRVPLEKSELLPYWFELVQTGFEPTLAFLLSYSKDGDDRKARIFQTQPHFWFDTSANWSSIIKGEMVKMSKDFKTKPSGCRPCNVIWGHSSDYMKLRNMSNKEISEFYELVIEPPVNNPPEPQAKGYKPGGPFGIAGINMEDIMLMQAAQDGMAANPPNFDFPDPEVQQGPVDPDFDFDDELFEDEE